MVGLAGLRARRLSETKSLFGLPARLALPMALLIVMLWSSCGGGATHTTLVTSAGTYTITVTATSGQITHAVNVTLTVR
jgi:hypothetical protein